MEFATPWTLYLPTFALLTSISFRLTCSPSAKLDLTPTTKRILIALHAFAVEGIQLALFALFCRDVFSMVLNTTCTDLTDIVWLVVKLCSRALLLVVGMVAVDVIEHLTIRGQWSWSTYGQMERERMFLLTREALWPTLKMWWKGLRVLGEGGLIVWARRGRLGGVEGLVLRRVGGRRWSESNIRRHDGGSDEFKFELHERSSASAPEGRAKKRRNSFPDDQLNTRPLLIDSRITSSIKSPPNYHGISTTKSSLAVSRGRSPTKAGKEKGKGKVRVSRDGSPERRSRVRSRVWEIEGGRSQCGREMDGSGLGERREKGRWRYPGKAT